jgi:hypothetical protein
MLNMVILIGLLRFLAADAIRLIMGADWSARGEAKGGPRRNAPVLSEPRRGDTEG